MRLSPAEVHDRARVVRLVLLDVDGVLTDGTVSIDSESGESKTFYIRDGAAIVWAQRHGLEVGFLSGRASKATSRRATELGVRILWQGGTDKMRGFNEIITGHGFTPDEVAYMADDLLDLPVLKRAGFAAAPHDAVEEVRDMAHWISQSAGGRGAVRELIEVILRARGSWDTVVKGFLT